MERQAYPEYVLPRKGEIWPHPSVTRNAFIAVTAILTHNHTAHLFLIR